MNQNKNTAYTMLGIAEMAIGLVAAIKILSGKSKAEMKKQEVSKLAKYGRLLSCSFIVSKFPVKFIVVQGVNYGRLQYNVSPSNRVQVADVLNVFEYLHR